MLSRIRFVKILVICLFALASTGALSAAAANKSGSNEAQRAREAGTVLDEVMGIPESIPKDLMDNATAIAVIPGVTKGAFVFGGRWGKGLVTHRGSDGRWSAPSYIDISGGSFGLQIGVSRTDLILVFTNDKGFRSILDGKVELGADASVAAGPVGRNAEAGTDVLLSSAIFSYSRSKGLFAGVALDGAALTIDDSSNKEAYGREVSAEDILLNGKVNVNDVVMPFVQAVRKHAPETKHITSN